MNALFRFALKPSAETFDHLSQRIIYRIGRIRKEISILFQPTNRSIDYAGFRVHFTKGNTLIEAMEEGNGIYEPDLSAALVEELKQHGGSPVFVDIGANIGLITLHTLRHIPDLEVYAFEPGPHQGSLLAKTIETNSLEKRVHLFRCALADKTGVAEFRIHRSRDSSGDGLRDIGWAGPTDSIQVEVNTIDHWWEESGCPKINCMKIDTEGAELLVLRGAVKMIERCHPSLFLEIADVNLKNYPYSSHDVFNFLEAAGYDLCLLNRDKLDYKKFQEAMQLTNNFSARCRSKNP